MTIFVYDLMHVHSFETSKQDPVLSIYQDLKDLIMSFIRWDNFLNKEICKITLNYKTSLIQRE